MAKLQTKKLPPAVATEPNSFFETRQGRIIKRFFLNKIREIAKYTVILFLLLGVYYGCLQITWFICSIFGKAKTVTKCSDGSDIFLAFLIFVGIFVILSLIKTWLSENWERAKNEIAQEEATQILQQVQKK